MTGATWSRLDRLLFYLAYAAAKIRLLWDVKQPKWTFFWFEVRYSLIKIRNLFSRHKVATYFYQGPSLIKTTRGHFEIRPNSIDATIVSPAYEARDIQFLIRQLNQLMHQYKDVGFVDIGANIGAFVVPVCLKFRGTPIKIWAVEPIPDNLRMLNRNLSLNPVQGPQVKVLPVALSERSGTVHMQFSADQGGDAKLTPGAGGLAILAVKGDEALVDLPAHLVIKIDVEGHELAVLSGLTQTLKNSKTCWICIEEDGKAEIAQRLTELGFTRQAKLSPYNSWWVSGRVSKKQVWGPLSSRLS